MAEVLSNVIQPPLLRVFPRMWTSNVVMTEERNDDECKFDTAKWTREDNAQQVISETDAKQSNCTRFTGGKQTKEA